MEIPLKTRNKTTTIVVVQSLSGALLFATPLTIARQAPLSMGFPRQEYWSGLSFPSPKLPQSCYWANIP